MSRPILRRLFEAFTPPVVFTIWRKLSGQKPMFGGNYASFEEAASHTSGYDTAEVGRAAAKLLPGLMAGPHPDKVIDERFLQVHAALCMVRDRLQKQRISVLDIGGANGSYYFRLKPLFPPDTLDWHVVETPSIVEACAPIAGSQIAYLTELPSGRLFDVILISGTLQYLSDGYGWLKRLPGMAPWLILTRLPVTEGPADKFVVQTVPAHLHKGSMPVEIFSAARMRAALAELGTIELSWGVSLDDGSLARVSAHAMGYLVRLR